MLTVLRFGKATRIARMVLTTGMTALALSGCAGVVGNNQITVELRGAQEVPPVVTAAHGDGLIIIGTDRSIKGRVTGNGLASVAAHIHLGEPGVNGPVSIGLVTIGENVWAVPPGTRLSEDQYRAFLKGDLYVNMHSAAHKGGEIRGQLRPLKNNW